MYILWTLGTGIRTLLASTEYREMGGWARLARLVGTGEGQVARLQGWDEGAEMQPCTTVRSRAMWASVKSSASREPIVWGCHAWLHREQAIARH